MQTLPSPGVDPHGDVQVTAKFVIDPLNGYGLLDRRHDLRRFSWREIQLATNNFSGSNIIGQGGFGKVYKGVLSDNTMVAVKRLTDYQSPGGEAAFLREVHMISVAVHRNLLRLVGVCTTSSEKILVYPFMQNLSVAYCLRGIHLKLLSCFTNKIFGIPQKQEELGKSFSLIKVSAQLTGYP
ncbi:hypothetical protein RJ639_036220 [Escallonia herrerae]|uniref:non-specific serine/threonine protein kinase n=1 Tax=Escallonia herrerae TaxID=1293975 RepID=A0AA89BHE1_9ASTE|nr:hypothetical protein RJ639_036220 [Escallonia herrerae]